MTATGVPRRGAGRVVAGTARGLRLDAPPGEARPMGDRLKEALFAILEPELRGARVLDLFAGSGAAGLEALSRGAGHVVFVDSDPGAIATIQRNLARTRLADRAEVHRGEVAAWLPGNVAGGPFAVVLLDPPYDAPELVERTVLAISRAGRDRILTTGGVLVAKHDRRVGLNPRIGLLASARERRFGESTLTFLRWAPEDQEAG